MIKGKWDFLISRPDLLFLFFSFSFGLLFIALVPPLGGSDEGFHYQRVASIGYSQLLNQPVTVPGGITDFIQSGRDFFVSDRQPPFGYSATQWKKMADMPLNADNTQLMLPNIMTVHNPFAYLTQVIAFRVGAVMGLTPLTILYITRLVGLVTAILLTFYAIRIIPSHKYALCAFALLPVITINRSVLNADTIVDAFAFLFVSLVLREIISSRALSVRNIAIIAVTGFILSQCKAPYLLLLFLTIAIPAHKFSSFSARIISLVIIILPAALSSFAWMLMIKQTSFSGVSYTTWGGEANPDMQLAFMLHHPFDFFIVMLRTLFMSSLLPASVLGIIEDIGPGRYLPVPVTVVILYCLIATIIADKQSRNTDYGTNARFLAACIFVCAFIMILALLYIHWSGVGASEIKGFQGRYFYPMIPLLFTFICPSEKMLMSFKSGTYIVFIGIIGLSFTAIRVLTNYY